ncbi:MAG: hypothetical protein MJZ42_02245 [Bacteroidales bacterium]|nr:hypothetical protein [Bacteroidales bacterium]
MKSRKRTKITLRSIKRLWKRMGRRPVEVPLISQKMIDEVTAQPRQATPVPILIPVTSQPHHNTSKLRYRLAAAASVLLLIGTGTFWLSQTSGGEKQMTAQVEFAEDSDRPVMNPLPISEVKKEGPRDDKCQYARVVEKHQWQTATALPSCREGEHDNAGIVCYSEGRISENCDDEMVTTMLLAFL